LTWCVLFPCRAAFFLPEGHRYRESSMSAQEIILIILAYALISVIATIFIVRLFRYAREPFDCLEDHADNMDDEGGLK